MFSWQCERRRWSLEEHGTSPSSAMKALPSSETLVHSQNVTRLNNSQYHLLCGKMFEMKDVDLNRSLPSVSFNLNCKPLSEKTDVNSSLYTCRFVWTIRTKITFYLKLLELILVPNVIEIRPIVSDMKLTDRLIDTAPLNALTSCQVA